jgi:hypothetical protein
MSEQKGLPMCLRIVRENYPSWRLTPAHGEALREVIALAMRAVVAERDATLTEMQGEGMTASELIAELQKLPPDAHMVVRGYESGVEEIEGIETLRVRLNANRGTWYYGRHEVDQRGDSTVFEIVGKQNADPDDEG